MSPEHERIVSTATAMREMDEFTRNRLIKEAGDKVHDLRHIYRPHPC